MALIQDIQPNGGKRPLLQSQPNLRDTLLQVHRATNLPNLAHKAGQRVSSFDILPPGQAQPKRPLPPSAATESLFRQRPAVARTKLIPPEPVAKTKPLALPSTAISGSVGKPTIMQRLGDFLQYPLIAALAIGAAYSSGVGQVCIGLFGLLSLVLSISSRYSFGGALLLLVSIPIFQVLKLSGVSQNAAIYAYELLVVGTVLAISELVRDNHKRKQLDKKAKNSLRIRA